MNKINKTLKALAVAGVVGISGLAVADTINGNLSFNTIIDIKVLEDQTLSFGESIIPKAGQTCSMIYKSGVVNTTTHVDTTTAGVWDIAGAAVTASGDCTNAGLSGGRFSLDGADNQSIKVTVRSFGDAFFTFTPAGNYTSTAEGTTITAAGTTTANGTDAQALVDAIDVKDFFADTLVTSKLDGNGVGTIYIGGTLNILQDLDAATRYAVTYDVEVTY